MFYIKTQQFIPNDPSGISASLSSSLMQNEYINNVILDAQVVFTKNDELQWIPVNELYNQI